MTLFYGIAFTVSVLMTGVYFYADRKRDIWLMCLFISVMVCDFGYFLLSMSKHLETALWGNRIAYLGSVFLPLCMLMMIMNLSRFNYPKWLPKVLTAFNSAVFFIAGSGGWLPIYYKDVSLEIIDGTAVLIKEYGPLHNLYKVFLFGYFAAMVIIIIYTAVKHTVISIKHSAFFAVIVIGNIAIWLVENIIGAGFEFLSISYIITECLILFLYGILQDYGLADTQIIAETTEKAPAAEIHVQETRYSFSAEQIDFIISDWTAADALSQREKEVLKLLLINKKRKEIAEELFVTESTIKKHTSGIFRKLEVSNRTELFEKASQFCSQNK